VYDESKPFTDDNWNPLYKIRRDTGILPHAVFQLRYKGDLIGTYKSIDNARYNARIHNNQLMRGEHETN
jgi:hypothetical protein